MNLHYFILLIGMTVITFITRRLLLRVPECILTKRVKNGLTFVPIGIFAGLVFPALFIQNSSFQWKPSYLLASVLCLLTMKVTKNFLLSFLVGTGIALIGNIL
ncbi:AzlD domain-containing protein [Bacillus cereus]|uniref:Branched-chain amino acid transporter AzlD n=1 Tax=Bacillus cereus HuA3-9 TaxID=1053205 RepID=R8CKB8_BACCE|nr:AzlD domain-containing protein [Bacillus cereus]EOO11965.1 hypothetical protein IGA_05194 [Bacillus cereus HuA3-9]